MSAVPQPTAQRSDAGEPQPSSASSAVPWPFIVAVALIALLAELAYSVVNTSTLPVYLTYGLHIPKLVGTAVASFLLAEALLNGPTGILADRVGRRALMIAGPMISVGTSILTALLRIPHDEPGRMLAISALIGLRFLDGAGAAALWPAVFASIGDRVPAARQSTAMGALNVSYMIGIAVGPLLGGLLNDRYARILHLGLHDPLRYVPSFVVAGAAFLLTSIIGMIVAPTRAEQRERAAAAAAAHAAASGSGGPSEGNPVTVAALIDTLRRIPALVALVFVLFFGIGLIAPNVKLYALQCLHVSEGGFGWLLLAPALIIALLAVPLGRLGDLWGKARAIQIGSGIAAGALWLLLAFESKLALEVIGSLLGIGFVLAFPAYLALLSEVGGDEARGSVIGAVKTFQGVGMLLGAVVGSPLFTRHPLAPFIGAAILLTAGFVLALVGVREPKRPVEAL